MSLGHLLLRIERNFNQATELKGIFTLGEENVDARQKIADATDEIERLNSKVAGLKNGLEGGDGSGGKKGELSKLENTLTKRCGDQKLKQDAKFEDAFQRWGSEIL